MTLDGLRDSFFVAHRACERFSKVLGGIAQKLQDAKADDSWLTEVRVCAELCYHAFALWCLHANLLPSVLPHKQLLLVEKAGRHLSAGNAHLTALAAEVCMHNCCPGLQAVKAAKTARVMRGSIICSCFPPTLLGS